QLTELFRTFQFVAVSAELVPLPRGDQLAKPRAQRVATLQSVSINRYDVERAALTACLRQGVSVVAVITEKVGDIDLGIVSETNQKQRFDALVQIVGNNRFPRRPESSLVPRD